MTVARKLIPANQVTYGNSSPGMFFLDFDLRLDLYALGTQGNAILFFDPVCEQVIKQTDDQSSGNFQSNDPRYRDIQTLDAQGNATGVTADVRTAMVETRDGWQYEFEMVDVPIGTDHYRGRIKTITSPEGFAKTFTYKSFSPAIVNSSPEIQTQIDTVTDPSGNVATFTYHADQQASRWAISQIKINGDMVTLDYQYNADGHLASVDKTMGPTGSKETVSTYNYGADTQWDAAYISWYERMWNNAEKRDTIYLASDYLLWDGELVNQFADVLIGRADGTGYRYMSISGSETTDGLYHIQYRGRLIEWQIGQSMRYYETWSANGNGGFDSYTGNLESTYAHHPGITDEQISMGRPPQMVDETGQSYTAQYDDAGNLYRKTHNLGGGYEQFLYDDKNRLRYYRDRAGFVTLTERNARGLVVRTSRGHVDLDGDGSATASAEATQTTYGYYADSHANAGLLKWMHTGAYSSGPVNDAPVNQRTDYAYNGSNQLVKVTKPLAEGQSTRSEVQYAWAAGEVFQMTDENDQVTSYNRDSLNRMAETVYPDGSTTQTYYTDNNNRVHRKDRNGVVSRTIYDAAGRMSQHWSLVGIRPTILTGQTSTNIANHLLRIRRYYYHAGRTQTRRVTMDLMSESETDHDYRGRAVVTRRFPSKNQNRHTSTMTYVDNMLLSTSDSFNGHTITTYNGYSADRFTVRKISTRVPTVTFADNAAVMNATRLSDQLDADFMIADAIRDQRGNLLQTIDGRGMITQNTYDALGRQLTTVRGQNTATPLTSSTAYNARGQVESTTDAAGMVSFTEYDDALNVKTRTVAHGTPLSLATSYTYDAKGRQKTMTDPASAVTTSHYDDCCSNISASENAIGFGSINVADSGGRTVYQASVNDQFDFAAGNMLDPAESQTLGETTTRYYPHGGVHYTTRWKSALGQIDPANPPVAGLDGVPLTDGVTTQNLYFTRIFVSGTWQSNRLSQTMTRLDGTSAVVSMREPLLKLAEPTSSGGADLEFRPSSSALSLIHI